MITRMVSNSGDFEGVNDDKAGPRPLAGFNSRMDGFYHNNAHTISFHVHDISITIFGSSPCRLDPLSSIYPSLSRQEAVSQALRGRSDPRGICCFGEMMHQLVKYCSHDDHREADEQV